MFFPVPGTGQIPVRCTKYQDLRIQMISNLPEWDIATKPRHLVETTYPMVFCGLK